MTINKINRKGARVNNVDMVLRFSGLITFIFNTNKINTAAPITQYSPISASNALWLFTPIVQNTAKTAAIINAYRKLDIFVVTFKSDIGILYIIYNFLLYIIFFLYLVYTFIRVSSFLLLEFIYVKSLFVSLVHRFPFACFVSYELTKAKPLNN